MLLKRIKTLSREILDLVFPRTCLDSAQALPSDSSYRYFSDSAFLNIHWVHSPHCSSCGYPFDGEIQSSRMCPNCIDLKPVFSEGRTAFLLRGAGKKLVHELKYHQGFHLWPDVAIVAKRVPGYLEFIENSVLVPVPLHQKKLRQRGFNQSLLLAQSLAKVSDGAQVQDLLLRTKKTRTQTHLTRKERQVNVKNAFALSSYSAINSTLSYILVDDVFTTGATLNACASVLKKNGAKKIKVLTLGHG